MTIVQRIAREPNAVIGVLVASYGVLVAFHVLVLSAQQVGAFTALGGAVVFALRVLTTPTSEVVAQQRPGDPVPIAGPASSVATGRAVHVTPTLPPDGSVRGRAKKHGAGGYASLGYLLVLAMCAAAFTCMAIALLPPMRT